MEVSELGQRILHYLAQNPEAGDTVEGILSWWLLDQAIGCWMPGIETALAELVTKRLVLTRRERKAVSYWLNRKRLPEIQRILTAAETTSAKK
jgi:hypothetical protein